MSIKIALGLLLAGVVSVGIDVLVGATRPGQSFVIGLGGCWLLIVGAKKLGQLWLSRPEDYYGSGDSA